MTTRKYNNASDKVRCFLLRELDSHTEDGAKLAYIIVKHLEAGQDEMLSSFVIRQLKKISEGKDWDPSFPRKIEEAIEWVKKSKKIDDHPYMRKF